MTVSPSLATAAHTVAKATVTPSCWRISARVRSGVAAINARMRSACAASFRTRVACDGLGAGTPAPPASRRRCFSRRTHDALTENVAATSSASAPASHAFNTRSRKSIEYGRMAPPRFGMPPV